MIKSIDNLSKKIKKIFKSGEDFKKDCDSNSENPLLGNLTQNHIVSRFPLSEGQKALWLLYQMSPDSAAYNTGFAWRIRTKMDARLLQGMIQKLVKKHPSLRTTFAVHSDGVPVQCVHENIRLDFRHIDCADRTGIDVESALEELMHQPFNLKSGPISRWALLTASESESIFFMGIHHIGVDMWSIMVLMNEFSELYSILRAPSSMGHDTKLLKIVPSPEFSEYSSYVEWQEEMIKGPRGARHARYWKKQLAGDLPLLNLMTDKPRPPIIQHKCKSHTIYLPFRLIAELRTLAKREDVSSFTIYLAAFQTLLHRYTGQEKIFTGTPATNGIRDLNYKEVVGYFVNPIALKADFSEDPSFIDFLKQINKTVSLSLFHRDYPFPLIVEKLQPERDPSRSPVIQSSIVWNDPNYFINTDTPLVTQGKNDKEIWKIGTLQWERLQLPNTNHNFDLNLVVNNIEGKISLSLEYNTELFEEDTIKRMTGHLHFLLEAVAKNPEQACSQLPLLTKLERHKLLSIWNDTATDYPKDTPIHQIFESQVEKTPEAIALVFEGQQLTYCDLNCKANQLARHLVSLGVGSEVMVGICADRSLESIIGTLGILKAGGAYVPLDPSYPKERLSFMLEDTKAPVLLIQKHLLKNFPKIKSQIVLLNNNWKQFAEHKTHNLGTTAGPENLAYVMYTSGSTGRPKGVCVTHRNVVRLVKDTDWVNLTANEIFLQFAPISFDAATFEIWGSLLNGAQLVIYTPGFPCLEEFGKFIVENGITTLWLTAGLFHQMVDHHIETLRDVRQLVAGGDVLSPRHVQKVCDELKECQLINGYGPTENTTFSCCFTVDRSKTYESSVPIGRPITNSRVFVLDRDLQPVPIGVPGELYTGGDGVARGYLKRPESTAERFIRNPFTDCPSDYLYKTGDLVCYLPDGNLEFLGRIDTQVKFRGFRIELAEIETLLASHPAICETVVLLREDIPGHKRLVAYIVPSSERSHGDDDLRIFLRNKLPEYMIPSAFISLERLPLTANGKVDRKSLPSVEMNSEKSKPTCTKPQSEIEKDITNVWQNVLHIDHIGVNDNFFDLGGHSLLVAQVYTQLPEHVKKRLKIVDLFMYPTIRKLCVFLGECQSSQVTFEEGKNQVKQTDEEDKTLKQDACSKIAIVGMAGRFPGAENPDEFWDNVKNGVESITQFTDEEMERERIDPIIWNDANYVKASGVLNEVDKFDADFFGFSPREAQITDPQHRLFLECAWDSLEHAGIDPERFDGAIGVYGGTGSNSYYTYHLAPNTSLLKTVGQYPILMGNEKDFLCSRISYKLNLNGPGVTVQTACSTSLVAVHMACQALISGDCDVVLAGGVSLGDLQKGYLYEEGMILSPDGKCKAFDTEAKGTVPGQGVGMVALKRLENAVNDGDFIHAVIIGSASNNDGSDKIGFSAPGAAGQADVIKSAHTMAKVSPGSISYIEAHGTGTPMGDPIEIAGLTRAFRSESNKSQFCAIGSVKPNIGHLDAAAGVTGLIKTALALKHKILPPSIHFISPNPAINFDDSPFYVNSKGRPWMTKNGPRRAGISSFGLGGTNAHVVLEEAPKMRHSKEGRPYNILTLSAKTESALVQMTYNLAKFLEKNKEKNFNDIAYTLHVGRTSFPHRKVLICENIDMAMEELKAGQSQETLSGICSNTPSQIAFLFSGQGTQYASMCRQIYDVEPTFRRTVDRCYDIAQKIDPEIFNRFNDIDNKTTETISDKSEYTQINVFIVEYALARLMQEWGIQPAYMIGHSLGEYTAACLSGVFSLEDTLRIVTLRAKLVFQHVPPGDMLSIKDSEQNIDKAIADLSLRNDVSIAAINSPFRCVVSGSTQAIQLLKENCDTNKINCHLLSTSHAFHSQMLEPILTRFEKGFRIISLSVPTIPFVSSVTGTWITGEEATDPKYWVRHLRKTVQFSKGLSTLYNKEENMIMLEVGPGNVLSTLARQNPDKSRNHVVLSTTHHPDEEDHDSAFLLQTLGLLWLEGIPIDWSGFHCHGQRYRIPLPTYPFQRERYWINAPKQDVRPDLFELKEQYVSADEIDSEISASRAHLHNDYVMPRDEIEKTIFNIWCKFLMIREIGIHDNFFELGGDSMTAIGVLNQLKKVLDISFSPHIILNHPTIAKLADYIKEETVNNVSMGNTIHHSLITEIQAGNSNYLPLFLVHPLGGHVYFYHQLAQNLDPSRPVYGIHAHGLDGTDNPINTIEALANVYIKEMKTIQPHGPYQIGGASFGGIVAYEMAIQLKRMEEELPFVTMIDSPGPHHMPILPEDSSGLLALIFRNLSLSPEKLRKMDTNQQIDYVQQQAKSIYGHTDVLPPDFGTTFFEVLNAHTKAMFGYSPGKLDGDILFFKHSEYRDEYAATPELAWVPLVKNMEIVKVGGDHLTMLFTPHVDTIAEFLDQFLMKIIKGKQ